MDDLGQPGVSGCGRGCGTWSRQVRRAHVFVTMYADIRSTVAILFQGNGNKQLGTRGTSVMLSLL